MNLWWVLLPKRLVLNHSVPETLQYSNAPSHFGQFPCLPKPSPIRRGYNYHSNCRILPVIPTYVLLTTFTQQGTENVRDSPERTDHAKEMVESLGGIWKGLFVTMGRYDGVVIVDFPDDATAAQAVLALAESGNVTTETLRAFARDEFRDIVDAMR